MTGPFIFIATNRLKQGKLPSEKKRLPDLIDFIHTNGARLIPFNEYAKEEGTEVAVVQVHPDADSTLFHMELIGRTDLRTPPCASASAQGRRIGAIEPTKTVLREPERNGSSSTSTRS